MFHTAPSTSTIDAVKQPVLGLRSPIRDKHYSPQQQAAQGCIKREIIQIIPGDYDAIYHTDGTDNFFRERVHHVAAVRQWWIDPDGSKRRVDDDVIPFAPWDIEWLHAACDGHSGYCGMIPAGSDPLRYPDLDLPEGVREVTQ